MNKPLTCSILFGLLFTLSPGTFAAQISSPDAITENGLEKHFRMVSRFDAIKNPEQVFIIGGGWIPYPAYSDRKAWDKLAGPFKKQLLAFGDEYLDYQWELQRASSYLEYEKTGNRELMRHEERNRKALVALLTAELVEGKGRYMSQLVDGIWFLCQQYSWSHGQHTTMQKSKRTLPRYDDAVVSLHGSATGAVLAFAHHFLREELDKLDPSISDALRREVKRQIVTPYEDDSMDKQHWWKGFHIGNHVVNNWNTFCNYNALVCTLLMEDDPARLARTIRRCCESTDIYLDYVKQDGACDEGPSYWGMACGTLYELLKVLQYASNGQFNLFDDPLIKRMGEFKEKTWFDGGWVMNYGDGGARELGETSMLFRYGQDTGSKELMDFSLFLLANREKKTFSAPNAIPGSLTGLLFRSLETMRTYPELKAYEKAALEAAGGDFDKMLKNLRSNITPECYPLTEYGIFRKGAWNLAAKGGHNLESHNHNDVGSAILIVDEMPVLVDPGVGEYVKDTFSKNRYKIWNMGSGWHNVPVINGEVQEEGREYRAEGTGIDLGKGIFSTDIAGAYPEAAACKSWIRSYILTDKSLTVNDAWVLNARKAADEIHFTVRGEVQLVKPGEIIITACDFKKGKTGRFRLSYPSGFTASVEEKSFSDTRLIRSWGMNSLRIITLKGSDKAPLKGKCTVKVVRGE